MPRGMVQGVAAEGPARKLTTGPGPRVWAPSCTRPGGSVAPELFMVPDRDAVPRCSGHVRVVYERGTHASHTRPFFLSPHQGPPAFCWSTGGSFSFFFFLQSPSKIFREPELRIFRRTASRRFLIDTLSTRFARLFALCQGVGGCAGWNTGFFFVSR